jgi:cobalt-zinc-cadmium resistance protein CzcA
VVYQVKQVYLTLQYLSARSRLLQRQDSIFADLVRITGIQYKTGEGTLLQKTSAETRYNEVQNLKRQNEADIASSQYQFRILLNADSDLMVEGNFETRELNLSIDSSAVAANPALQYQRSLAEVAFREKKVESNRTLPDLTIGYFNQSLIGYQQFSDGTNPYFDSKHRFTGFTAGIAIPLWFVPHYARVKSLAVHAEATKFNAAYFLRQLQSEWEKAAQELIKTKASLDYYTQLALPNARLIIRQSQTGYRTGELSQAEYRLNLQQGLAIEEGYLQSLLQYNQSVIRLEYLSGQPNK